MTERNETPKTNTTRPDESQLYRINFVDSSGITFTPAAGDTPAHLILAPGVAYPAQGAGRVLDALLLDEAASSDGKRHLQLPRNFVTMTEALNDAIGDNAAKSSIGRMSGLLAELGDLLRKVVDEDGLAPSSLHYKNIIFLREAEGAKLFPPIEFVPVETGTIEETKERLANELGSSSLAGASNSTQVNNLPAVMNGFKQAIGR